MSRFSYTIVNDVITAVTTGDTGTTIATIPDTVTGVANNVFENNTVITQFICTENSLLNYLGNNVFSGCTNLTSVTLGTSQTSFGSYCFSNCTSLPNISIPPSIITMGEYAFLNCTSFTSIEFNENIQITTFADGLFQNTGLEFAMIPSGVTSIGNYCFYQCSRLLYNGGDPCEIVGDYAYSGTSLSSCGLYRVDYIGSRAFYNCPNLSSIFFYDRAPPISIAIDAFENTQITAISYNPNLLSLSSLHIDTSLLTNISTTFGTTYLAPNTFENLNIPSITINNNITSIGANAFLNCANLTSVTFNNFNSTPTITAGAFNGCNAITNVSFNIGQFTSINQLQIPLSLFKNIAVDGGTLTTNFFQGLTNLTGVTINGGVSTIESGAFNGCNSITNVSFNIDNFTSISQLQIPLPLLLTNIAVNGETLPTDFFKDLTNLTGVTINGGVTTIRTDSFKNCSALTSITFNHNIYYGSPVSIDAGAFNGCNAITNLTFSPDIIPTISQLQIPLPLLLTNITIINNSTVIPTSLFEGLTNLTAVSLPDTLNVIDSNSFKNCTALLNITIPTSVSLLGANAFQNCTSLTDVTIPNLISSINNDTFNGCSSLQEVTIGSLESSIGDYAFANCDQLQTVTIGNLLLFSRDETITPSFNNLSYVGPGPYTSIGDYAFYNDVSLNSFVIPESTTSIGAHAFENCISLPDITIPQDVDVVGIEAFKNCTGLTSVTLDCAGTFTLMSQNSFQNTTSINSSSSTITNLLAKGYTTPDLIFAGFNMSGPLPCFKEDSKILCLVDGIEKELRVQDIRNGVLVKTELNGYVPVCMIGTSKMNNPENQNRFADRLYLCSKDKYPELNEDLVITGCHAILVDDFKEGQREKTMERFGRVFITGQKYRLIACIDERAAPYCVEGEFNIYHIALENDNYYSNFGIYANGLLVESCSKRYLKELSNMTLL
jgi:hypothetical protein